jgi:hypothetical protein
MTFYPEDRAIQAERAMDRQRAMQFDCRYCMAMEHQECHNKATGEPLAKMAAHLFRLQDCGLA